jgi:uncharacterized protein YdaU (DUF1376 family)
LTKRDRDPSFPLYAADWLTGEATTEMLPEQEGPFIRLLCYAWLANPPCTIPNDDKVLAQVSKLGTRWRRLGALVKAQFAPMPDDPSRLRNAKLWEIHQKREAFRQTQAEKGRKGGRPKAEIKPEVNRTESRGEADGKVALSFAVASAFPEEESTIPPRSGGSGGIGEENRDRNRSGWQPVWTQKAFQYRVDKVQDFVKRAKSHDKIGPGDEDFDAAFFGAFSMTWDYWTAQSEAHQAHFGALARGAA